MYKPNKNSIMDKSANITNRIKQSPECCVYCGKGYKARKNLEKHIMLCEIYHNPKKRKIVIEEDEPLPSQRVLYEMVVQLALKYNKMEEKIDELNKLLIKEKKKINVFEWLNNKTPGFTYEELIDKMIINNECIDYLFKNSFIDTFMDIFSKTIESDVENLPIRCFTQKPNHFYIYDKNEKDELGWQELSREKLMYSLNKFHMKISKGLFIWRQNNSEFVMNNDNNAILYDKTYLKLMSVDFRNDNTINKIRSQIFALVKVDLKSFVEYEFNF
jgi:hypothetical protein